MVENTKRPPKHPAKFSHNLIPAIARWVEDGASVLDPFAGVGGIFGLLKYKPRLRIQAVEIEPLWAAADARIVCADALAFMAQAAPQTYDYVVTSPCYGNRMADHHEARDPSVRNTYRHSLGQPLAEGSAAGLQWGPAYRTFHLEAWRLAYRATMDYGGLILNVKDHVRGGKPQGVVDWHIRAATAAGWRMRARQGVVASGLLYGANRGLRAPVEEIIFFRKMPSD
jgi:hypothetical protein